MLTGLKLQKEKKNNWKKDINKERSRKKTKKVFLQPLFMNKFFVCKVLVKYSFVMCFVTASIVNF